MLDEDERPDWAVWCVCVVLAMCILFYIGVILGTIYADTHLTPKYERWTKMRMSINVEDCRRLPCTIRN